MSPTATLDLSSLPIPADAPEPRACVRLERPEPGLIQIVLDPPHRPSLAVFDLPLLRDLSLALDEVEKDNTLTGLVIAGRSPLSFAGGADIDAIGSVTSSEDAARFVRFGQQLFQRIACLGRTHGGSLFTVAAVGGPVPGGACEITLACDRIVLADDPKTRIGLPEVKLGIFPAWGGTQRLPRRIGIPAAMTAILSGRLYGARQAKKMGLVDRLAKPAYLLGVAGDIAMGRSRASRPRRGIMRFLVDLNPFAAGFIASQARKGVMKATKGHYPAPFAAIQLVATAPRVPLEIGLEKEVDAIKSLAISPIAKSLVGLFQLTEEAKATAELASGGKAPRIQRAGVLGGGIMGAGIAGLMAEKGVATRLRDLDQAQLDAAEHTHRAAIEKKRKKRRLLPHEANAAIDRLEVTTEPHGFDRCEIVIEAVAERLEIKRAVFRELSERISEDAILATNTSSLSVDAIAEGVPHPERVVGMHFFNPVRQMPLVEIVRGEHTSDEVVARTARLALDLGKTPVIVSDVAGFLVNRILGPYLDEAVRLLEAGADPGHVDELMVGFGMPMGPCELLDEVGLDIAAHAAESLEAAYGERMRPSFFLRPLVEAGMFGKKTGSGIYTWSTPGGGKRPTKTGLNTKAPTGAGAFGLRDTDIVDRLVLVMVNEAARCLEEGVVASARELDLATVFGTGFAPFRGGLMRYADSRGPGEIVNRLEAIATAPDLAGRGDARARFSPAPLMADLAREGATFHG